MNDLLKRQEDYLLKKLSHLFFEILEYPQKKEILYLGLCYCQLSRFYNLDEIPLREIKNCLRKYLIDFESYPWRDFLFELELFYLREEEDKLIKGKSIFSYSPSEEATLSIDPKYGFLKQTFCQKIYKYWYTSRKFEERLHAPDGYAVLKNGVELFNEGLYSETLQYLDDYLPLLKNSDELLFYRLLRQLAFIGTLIERKLYKEAYTELERTLEFLKDFNRELKKWPYDFKKLKKELKNTKVQLKRGKFLYIPPVRLVEKKKRWSFWKFLKSLIGKKALR